MTTTTKSQTLQYSDLIFSDTRTDFNKLLTDLKKSTLSLQNRLRSIEQDASFADTVARAYDLPLIANERCGSWYIPPAKKCASAYFKSTDGHTAQWSFSLRRLNLQVLDVVAERGGCVIVDSTRRGKSMPDALSKTVPVWTCVMNRFFFPDRTEYHGLSTPPAVVGRSEHAQMEARIEGFVQALRGLGLDLEGVKQRLRKPLRPIWCKHESSLPADPPVFDDFYPVVCCTSSRRVVGGEVSEGGYIQGAGDDAESWAYGLTPPLFWSHRDELMRRSEEELPEFIRRLVEGARVGGDGEPTLIKPTEFLYISTIEAAENSTGTAGSDLVLTTAAQPSTKLKQEFGERNLHLNCAPGKVGSRQLRHELTRLSDFLLRHLSTSKDDGALPKRILVTCPTGKDHSIGVALALLCLASNTDGTLRDLTDVGENNVTSGLSKHVIKQKLSWISVSIPEANPSRATLQSVNAFLLG